MVAQLYSLPLSLKIKIKKSIPYRREERIITTGEHNVAVCLPLCRAPDIGHTETNKFAVRSTRQRPAHGLADKIAHGKDQRTVKTNKYTRQHHAHGKDRGHVSDLPEEVTEPSRQFFAVCLGSTHGNDLHLCRVLAHGID